MDTVTLPYRRTTWSTWWSTPVPFARITALRVLAYAFIPLDVLWTTAWIAEHRFVPGALYRPVLLARVLRLPTPTDLGVRTLQVSVVAVSLMALAAALRRARWAQLLGALTAVLYLWWQLVGQSYGKVDHDRYGFLVLLFVVPTVGFTRSEERLHAESAGWAIRMIQIAVVSTYVLAAWAKIRFGGWGWMNGATLTRAVLRRGTGLSRWTLESRWFLRGFQWFLVLFEAGSIVMLFVRSRRLYVIVALLVVFHVTTFLMLRIIFLPHLVALTAFLPLERLVPIRAGTATEVAPLRPS